MIPESIQKLLSDRDEARAQISEAEKSLAAAVKKEKALTQKIEAAWAGQVQKIIEVLR